MHGTTNLKYYRLVESDNILKKLVTLSCIPKCFNIKYGYECHLPEAVSIV